MKQCREAIHPVFAKYPNWHGRTPEGFLTNWAGSLIRKSFHSVCQTEFPLIEGQIGPRSPEVEKEIFEWIDLLQAIDAARGSFTMMEIGAGYGRWLISGAVMLRRWKPMPFKLVAVEAEPTHFEMLLDHFLDNGFITDGHTLINAAANATGRPVKFTAGHSQEWYGQAIVPDSFVHPELPQVATIEVPGIRLSSVLAPLERVDFCDLDIQGAEAEVVEEAIELLTEKVCGLYISTHSRDVEDRLKRVLVEAGWSCLRSYPFQTEVETEFGRISLVDGVQSWRNWELARSSSDSRSKLPAQPPGPTGRESRMGHLPGPGQAVEERTLRVATAGAQIERSGSEIIIRTPPEPWGYAAAIDVHPYHAMKRTFVVEVELTVSQGSIYVCLADKALTTIGAQNATERNDGSRQFLTLSGSSNEGRTTILFRNGPDGGPSFATVHSFRVYS